MILVFTVARVGYCCTELHISRERGVNEVESSSTLGRVVQIYALPHTMDETYAHHG